MTYRSGTHTALSGVSTPLYQGRRGERKASKVCLGFGTIQRDSALLWFQCSFLLAELGYGENEGEEVERWNDEKNLNAKNPGEYMKTRAPRCYTLVSQRSSLLDLVGYWSSSADHRNLRVNMVSSSSSSWARGLCLASLLLGTPSSASLGRRQSDSSVPSVDVCEICP